MNRPASNMRVSAYILYDMAQRCLMLHNLIEFEVLVHIANKHDHSGLRVWVVLD
jgi:hypothetical protein